MGPRWTYRTSRLHLQQTPSVYFARAQLITIQQVVSSPRTKCGGRGHWHGKGNRTVKPLREKHTSFAESAVAIVFVRFNIRTHIDNRCNSKNICETCAISSTGAINNHKQLEIGLQIAHKLCADFERPPNYLIGHFIHVGSQTFQLNGESIRSQSKSIICFN